MLKNLRVWVGLSSAPWHSHGHDDGHQRHHPGHPGSGDAPHGHTHGLIDPSLATTERGIWAVKWSFIILATTAALQIGVVILSGSVALLADTIHNVADATTAIPLWIAFVLARRKPTSSFTYGYGRVEDLAGIAIVLIILFSALVAGHESVMRFIRPQEIVALGWVAAAGIVGFLGNEAVAIFRIRVGREINSAALIADGYHARTDGLTSLAVVLGAFGVWLGFPLADPAIGLIITLVIFAIVWQSARAVLTRMLDGIDPRLLDDMHHAAGHVAGIEALEAVHARWIGHRLHAELAIRVDNSLTVGEAARVIGTFRQALYQHLPALAEARIRLASGSESMTSPPMQILRALHESR